MGFQQKGSSANQKRVASPVNSNGDYGTGFGDPEVEAMGQT